MPPLDSSRKQLHLYSIREHMDHKAQVSLRTPENQFQYFTQNHYNYKSI